MDIERDSKAHSEEQAIEESSIELVPPVGLEPTASSLQMRRSAN